MTEIVLSIKNESGQNPVSMAKEIVELILDNNNENYPLLSLHADWSHPPEYSEWLFKTIKDEKIQTRVCTDSIHSLDSIKHLLSDEIHIELSLHRDNQIPPQPRWDEINNLSFFLLIDSPSPDGSLYNHILESIPEQRKVILGINWENRLSGPEQISADDHLVWSDTIIALVDKLSQKKISAGFGCGLKLCMFNRDQLGHLPKKLVNWPIAHCSKSFFFDPKGNMQPCVRLIQPGEISLLRGSSFPEAAEIFEKWLMPYSSTCYETGAFDCRSLKVGSCDTGCLQHSIEEWQSS